MTRRGALACLASGAGGLVLSACGLLDKRSSYRFRMTVEIASAGAVSRASAVYEVRVVKNGSKLLPDERSGGSRLFGEAIAVDVPGRETLFVLLKPTAEARGALAQVVTQALRPNLPQNGIDQFIVAVRSIADASGALTADLPRQNWPLMVRFREPHDPLTVEEVKPEIAGVRRITVQVTADPVTRRLDKRLPWLRDDRDSRLDRSGTTLHPTFAQTLSHDDFRSDAD